MTIKRISRALAIAALALLLASPAYAHDAVAGEELSGATEIFAISLAFLAIGAVICFWAWRRGQFTNVEEPKFTMLAAESPLDYACLELPDDEDEKELATTYVPTAAQPASPQYASVEAHRG